MTMSEARENIGKVAILKEKKAFKNDVREYGIIHSVDSKYVNVILGRNKLPTSLLAEEIELKDD
jgi:hypothetical protein